MRAISVDLSRATLAAQVETLRIVNVALRSRRGRPGRTGALPSPMLASARDSLEITLGSERSAIRGLESPARDVIHQAGMTVVDTVPEIEDIHSGGMTGRPGFAAAWNSVR